jgi:uncharacterized phage protein (TIGR02216 family)
MSALDWTALLRAGLSQLRLRPDEFWSLSPIEFLALTGHLGAAHATTRDALERLSRAFPDHGKPDD